MCVPVVGTTHTRHDDGRWGQGGGRGVALRARIQFIHVGFVAGVGGVEGPGGLLSLYVITRGMRVVVFSAAALK